MLYRSVARLLTIAAEILGRLDQIQVEQKRQDETLQQILSSVQPGQATQLKLTLGKPETQ